MKVTMAFLFFACALAIHGDAVAAPPCFEWSSFIGGSAWDHPRAVARMSNGDLVIVGNTESTDFPGFGGPSALGHNVFVSRISAAGDVLLWTRVFGGDGDETPRGVAVDGNDRIIVVGHTWSSNYPVTSGVIQSSLVNVYDAFVTILSPGGGIVASTYFGGGEADEFACVAVAPDGDLVIGGTSNSADFRTTAGAYDEMPNGRFDAVVVKLSPTLTTLVWSTVLGSTTDPLSDEWVAAIALDAGGHVVVGGNTGGGSFPTTMGAADTVFNGGTDAFVAKLGSNGSSLMWSTFLGGSMSENIVVGCLRLASGDRPVVAGWTQSDDFPTTLGADEVEYGGSQLGFVGRLANDGTEVEWCTYVGREGHGAVSGLFVDQDDFPYITGSSTSSLLNTTDPLCVPTKPCSPGIGAAFVARLHPSGAYTDWDTFIGCGEGLGVIGVPTENAVFVIGHATGDVPITTGAFDPDRAGLTEGFVSKIASRSMVSVQSIESPRGSRDIHVWPNPSHGSVAIEFEVGQGVREATLGVMDLAGRQVAILHVGSLTSGPHRFVWDRRGRDGRPIRPGIYVIGLRTDGDEARRKIAVFD